MADPFIGEIRIFPYNFAPKGWALCNGQTLKIAEYNMLFAVINTTYGGDGYSTFLLPNLTASVVAGQGTIPGFNYIPLGMSVGTSIVALQESQMPTHKHAILVDNVEANLSTPQQNTLAQGGKSGRGGRFISFDNYSDSGNADKALSSQAIGASGKGSPHENRQPFLVSKYCIALDGIFPSRQ